MSDHDRIRQQLESRLAMLAGEVRDLEDSLRAPHSRDAEERATEREGEEVMESLERGALDEIAQIKSALTRIEDGSYGICDSCGEPIGSGRLEALPSATSCISCAE